MSHVRDGHGDSRRLRSAAALSGNQGGSLSLRGRILAGCVLAVFGIALALTLLEVGVRVLHLVPTRFWQPDPLLGTRLIPGKEGWWTQEEIEFRVPIRINSAGFRDVEHAVEKPAGTIRVLVLGDSFIEALQVPLENTFARQLEHRLNRSARHQRYEVISMGVSGYGTAGEWLAYREYGRRYTPDAVLLALYPGNDVRNNSPTLEPVLRPEYDEQGKLVRVLGAAPRRTGRRGWRSLLPDSAAYAYLRKMVLTQHPVLARQLTRVGMVAPGVLQQVPQVDGVPVDYWVYAAKPRPEWEVAWRHTEDLLAAFRAAVEDDGARFIIAIVGAREIVYPEQWQRILDANPTMRRIEWDLEGPERRLTRWCAANGVPCLPLAPVFRAQAASGARLHFAHDGHWTAAGHALAAETVAGALPQSVVLTSLKGAH